MAGENGWRGCALSLHPVSYNRLLINTTDQKALAVAALLHLRLQECGRIATLPVGLLTSFPPFALPGQPIREAAPLEKSL